MSHSATARAIAATSGVEALAAAVVARASRSARSEPVSGTETCSPGTFQHRLEHELLACVPAAVEAGLVHVCAARDSLETEPCVAVFGELGQCRRDGSRPHATAAAARSALWSGVHADLKRLKQRSACASVIDWLDEELQPDRRLPPAGAKDGVDPCHHPRTLDGFRSRSTAASIGSAGGVRPHRRGFPPAPGDHDAHHHGCPNPEGRERCRCSPCPRIALTLVDRLELRPQPQPLLVPQPALEPLRDDRLRGHAEGGGGA